MKSYLHFCFSSIFSLLITVLLGQISYALEPSSGPEFSVFLGGVYLPNATDGQTLELPPYEIGPYADTFTNQSNSSAWTWGIGAGYRFKLPPMISTTYLLDSIEINADFYQLSHMTQTGDVLQFGLSEFDNYTYKLGLSNIRAMTDFDFDFHPIGQIIIPFIEGGIGAARTKISYSSSPISPVPGPGLQLDDQTDWSFAYQVGGGFKWLAKPQLELSIRYLYVNMGTIDSATESNSASLSQPLKIDMSTQNILLGLTYLLS